MLLLYTYTRFIIIAILYNIVIQCLSSAFDADVTIKFYMLYVHGETHTQLGLPGLKQGQQTANFGPIGPQHRDAREWLNIISS